MPIQISNPFRQKMLSPLQEKKSPGIVERGFDWLSKKLPRYFGSKEWTVEKEPELKPTITPTPTEMVTPTKMPTPTPTRVPTLSPARPTESPMIEPKIPTLTPTPTPTQVKIARNPDAVKLVESASSEVSEAISLASKEFDVPQDLLADIIYQESKFDASRKASDHGFDGVTINKETGKPYPYSSATGLFQFIDATWEDIKRLMGDLLPKDAERTDPVASARAAAWAISNGYLSWWNESKGVWGEFYEDKELEEYYK